MLDSTVFVLLSVVAAGPVEKPDDELAALLHNFRVGSKEARIEAAYKLGRLGRKAEAVVPVLAGAMDDRDFDVKWAAGRALRNVGSDAVNILLPQLAEGTAEGRATAADAFHFIGPAAKSAVPALMGAIRDSRKRDQTGNNRIKWETLRSNAILALGEIGPDAEAAVPLLVDVLETDEDPFCRDLIVTAFGKIGAAAQVAVPALAKVYEQSKKDEREFDRLQVVESLGGFAPHGKEAIPVLRAALQDKGFRVRDEAAEQLLRFGNEVAVPAMVELLCSEDEDSRMVGFDGMCEIGAPAVPALIELFQHDDALVRMEAARLIYYIGPQAFRAVGALEKALKDQDAIVREFSAIGLAEIGRPSQPAVPALLRALTDDHAGVRRYAAFGLATAGASPEMVANGLVAALDDEDPYVLSSVAVSLATLRITDQRALTKLVKILDIAPGTQEHYTVYFTELAIDAPEAAIMALSNYGPRAVVAKPALLELIKENLKARVTASALAVLGKIGINKTEAKLLSMGCSSGSAFTQRLHITWLVQFERGVR